MAERITNEVLAVELRNLTVAITKLEGKFDGFTPTNVMELRFAEVQRDILEMKKSLVEHEKNNQDKYIEIQKKISKSNWKTHMLTASLTFLMTFLTGFFLTNLFKVWG